MRERLWDNPEARRLAAIVTALLLVFLAAFVLLWHGMTTKLQGTLHAGSLAVIGQLAEQHPEWKDDVAAAFARTTTAQDVAVGEAAAARFGFDKRLPLALDADLLRFDVTGIAIAAAAVLALLALLLLSLLRALRSLYGKVTAYADMAERLVEGDFAVAAIRPAEGVFAKLAHQFNQMANRLELTLERLQQEKEAMKEFLSDISHQLKTPLAGIKMMTELLQDSAGRDERVRAEFLARSAAQVERMEWLIRQLLLVARIEAGALALRLESKPLLPTVQRVVDSLAGRWEAKGPRVQVAADGETHTPFAHDADWLAEAIGNLLQNSIEHTPPGGRVDVELHETPVLARLVIRDNGTGIAGDDLPHIFKRFYKGHTPLSANGSSSGTGIGLSLAKAIVERHGGFIAVHSAPGQGTTLTLTFAKTV